MQICKDIKLGFLLLAGVSFYSLLTTIKTVNASNSIAKTDVDQLIDPQSNPSKFKQSLLISSLIDHIYRAKKELGEDPSRHNPMAIPLGTDSPLRIGELDDNQLNNSNYMAVGYLSSSGTIQPINGDYILRGFGQLIAEPKVIETCINIGGHLPISHLPVLGKPIHHILAKECAKHAEDATNRLFNISSNLVVYNNEDQHLYIVEHVNPHALLKNAVNGILNHGLRKNFNFSDFEPIKHFKRKTISVVPKLPRKNP